MLKLMTVGVIMIEYLQILWKYLLTSAPYLLFGLFISGLIHQWAPLDKIKDWLGGSGVSSVFKAAFLGVPLPLCSCSVIPTAVTLKKNGASNGATSAFLISTPESGVDSISLTYALIDLPMTIIRPLAAFSSAFLAGILQHYLNKFEFDNKSCDSKKSCCSKENKNTKVPNNLIDKLLASITFGFGKLINDIATWLAIGILLGALIDLVMPDDFFASLSLFQNKFMILIVGIPLYICASASTPIAVSLMLKGLSPGGALLFLLVGPATNISNIAVLQKYIGKKGVIINLISIVLVALAFSFLTDYLYSSVLELQLREYFFLHEHESSWWQVLSALILAILLIKGIYLEKIRPYLKKM